MVLVAGSMKPSYGGWVQEETSPSGTMSRWALSARAFPPPVAGTVAARLARPGTRRNGAWAPSRRESLSPSWPTAFGVTPMASISRATRSTRARSPPSVLGSRMRSRRSAVQAGMCAATKPRAGPRSGISSGTGRTLPSADGIVGKPRQGAARGDRRLRRRQRLAIVAVERVAEVDRRPDVHAPQVAGETIGPFQEHAGLDEADDVRQQPERL